MSVVKTYTLLWLCREDGATLTSHLIEAAHGAEVWDYAERLQTIVFPDRDFAVYDENGDEVCP